MPAAAQFGVGAVLTDRLALLGHRGEFRPGGPGFHEIREDRAVPLRQRLAEGLGRGGRRAGGQFAPSLLGQPPGAVQVDQLGVDAQQIAGRVGQQDHLVVRPVAPGECGTERGDGVLHHLPGGDGLSARPQGVDQPAGGDDLVGVQQQITEHRPLLRPGHRDGPAVPALDGERPQYPEPYGLRIVRARHCDPGTLVLAEHEYSWHGATTWTVGRGSARWQGAAWTAARQGRQRETLER